MYNNSIYLSELSFIKQAENFSKESHNTNDNKTFSFVQKFNFLCYAAWSYLKKRSHQIYNIYFQKYVVISFKIIFVNPIVLRSLAHLFYLYIVRLVLVIHLVDGHSIRPYFYVQNRRWSTAKDNVSPIILDRSVDRIMILNFIEDITKHTLRISIRHRK